MFEGFNPIQKIQRDPGAKDASSADLNPEQKPHEQAPLSEQEKNIQQVFKLNPELENVVIEATKSGNFSYLYRIENKNIIDTPDGVTSHEDLKGQWFSPDLATALRYLRKSQQTFKSDAQRVMGANLVIAKVSKQQMDGLHVAKHPVASQMDVESDNYIIPENVERTYINVDDVQDKVGRIENFNKAKEQINEKVKQFELKEAVQLYQEYLKSVFPETKMEEIVWHGTTSEEEFEEFDINRDSSFGFQRHGSTFFTSNTEDAKTRGSGSSQNQAKRIIPAKLNIKNPLATGEKEIFKVVDDIVAEGDEEIKKIFAIEGVLDNWKKAGWEYRIENRQLILQKPKHNKYAGLLNKDGDIILDLSSNMGFVGNLNEDQIKPLKQMGYDGIIDNTEYTKLNGLAGDKKWVITFDPTQIQILGSARDIEEFKQFASKQPAQKE